MSNEGATRLLPAPCSDGDSGTTKLEVGSESGLKFDALGPMVVNRDGTLSRIANWQNMTEFEKQRTMRVLIARNKVRLTNQEMQSHDNTSAITQS